MVGDQQQLPATVFSAEARAANYHRSLFQRLIETGHPYIMLDTQYRMSPDICAFPSGMFYKNQLKSGDNVKAADYLPPFIKASTVNSDNTDAIAAPAQPPLPPPPPTSSSSCPQSPPLPPPLFSSFMFFDLLSSRESTSAGGSQSNSEEAALCVSLIQALVKAAQQAKCASVGTIGVITFYLDQLGMLRRAVQNANLPIMVSKASAGANGNSSASSTAEGSGKETNSNKSDNATATTKANSGRTTIQEIDLNTVDGFQGKENDIIIVSAVRANDAGTVGFLADLRRMNVGLTRARRGLFVVGNAYTLSHNRQWRELMEQAQLAGAFITVPNAKADICALLRRHNGGGGSGGGDGGGPGLEAALQAYMNAPRSRSNTHHPQSLPPTLSRPPPPPLQPLQPFTQRPPLPPPLPLSSSYSTSALSSGSSTYGAIDDMTTYGLGMTNVAIPGGRGGDSGSSRRGGRAAVERKSQPPQVFQQQRQRQQSSAGHSGYSIQPTSTANLPGASGDAATSASTTTRVVTMVTKRKWEAADDELEEGECD